MISIVGNGVVGKAIQRQLTVVGVECESFDPREEWIDGDAYIICVPTPNVPGSLFIETKYVENALQRIDFTAPVLIKSTISIGFLQFCEEEYKNVCFSPEFLRERHAVQDSLTEDKFIIGGTDENCEYWIDVFQPFIDANCGDTYKCTLVEAGLIKLAENAFLSTKVTFANFINSLARKLGVSYDSVAKGLQMDHRLGSTHWQVPGPDEQYGFGGKCLPKDTKALMLCSLNNGIEPDLLNTVLSDNNKYRKLEDN